MSSAAQHFNAGCDNSVRMVTRSLASQSQPENVQQTKAPRITWRTCVPRPGVSPMHQCIPSSPRQRGVVEATALLLNLER